MRPRHRRAFRWLTPLLLVAWLVAPVLPKLVRGNLFEPDSLEFGLGK